MLMNFIVAWRKDVEKMHQHLEFNHGEYIHKKDLIDSNNVKKAEKI